MVLYPWQYDWKDSDDYFELYKVGSAMQRKVKNQSQRDYRLGSGGKTIYRVGGSSMDWMHSLGIIHTFTIELSPENEHENGFEIDHKLIESVGQDALIMTQIVLEMTRICDVELLCDPRVRQIYPDEFLYD